MQKYFRTMTDAYPYLIGQILERGNEIAPRGLVTRELLDVSFVIENVMTGGVPINIGRKVGVRPMAIDGLQNLSGFAWPRVALATGPFLQRFANILQDDDLEIVKDRSGAEIGEHYFQGTYGPRMMVGLGYVEDELRRDPYSRRAVINLWDQNTDFDISFRDRPCTTQLQFLIRDGGLELFVTMRSNDIWTGTCYDIWQFGQVQQAMAHILNESVGQYHHHAISLHAYEEDWDKLAMIGPFTYNTREDPGADWSELKDYTYESIRDIQSAFIRIGASFNDGMIPNATNPVEEWYIKHLRPAL